jgi:hypothetical protein
MHRQQDLILAFCSKKGNDGPHSYGQCCWRRARLPAQFAERERSNSPFCKREWRMEFGWGVLDPSPHISSLVDARGQDVGGGCAVDAAEVKLVGVGLLEGLADKVGLRAALPGEVGRWSQVYALHTGTVKERGGGGQKGKSEQTLLNKAEGRRRSVRESGRFWYFGRGDIGVCADMQLCYNSNPIAAGPCHLSLAFSGGIPRRTWKHFQSVSDGRGGTDDGLHLHVGSPWVELLGQELCEPVEVVGRGGEGERGGEREGERERDAPQSVIYGNLQQVALMD